jgi:nitroreductase
MNDRTNANANAHAHTHALDLLRTRRSPKLRDFLDSGDGPGPSDAQLETMLTIAARVPDHGRLTPWRFVVIAGEGRERLGAFIGRCFEADHPDALEDQKTMARRRLCFAPVVVAVVSCPVEHPKVPVWEQELSAGAACMNLIHGAHAMGYAAVWLTEWYAFDARVLAELGCEAGQRLAGFVHIGRADGVREDRERPGLSDVVRRY